MQYLVIGTNDNGTVTVRVSDGDTVTDYVLTLTEKTFGEKVSDALNAALQANVDGTPVVSTQPPFDGNTVTDPGE